MESIGVKLILWATVLLLSPESHPGYPAFSIMYLGPGMRQEPLLQLRTP